MYPHTVPPVEYPAVQNGEKFRNFLRKSPASFSWDWGPAFIPSGIWKPVSLIYKQDLYVERAGVRTRVVDVGKGIWRVEIEVRIISLVKLRKNPSVEFEITQLDDGSYLSNKTYEKVFTKEDEDKITLTLTVNVSGVKLWHPKNHGEQTLYQLSMELCTVTNCVALSRNFGFRTVTLNQQQLSPDDPAQKKFEFVVNNNPVYIKGANLVPLSVFTGNSVNLTTLFDLVEFAGKS